MLSNKLYDILKWVGLILLPACAWLIGRIGPVWGLANVDAIVVTLNALGTFVGVLIGVSTLNYNKKGDGAE